MSDKPPDIESTTLFRVVAVVLVVLAVIAIFSADRHSSKSEDMDLADIYKWKYQELVSMVGQVEKVAQTPSDEDVDSRDFEYGAIAASRSLQAAIKQIDANAEVLIAARKAATE